jgi:hypothetical protein
MSGGIPGWSRNCWSLFHGSSYQYKEFKQEHFIEFYTLMTDLIPCSKCAKGISIYLKKNKHLLNDTMTDDDMIIWVNDLHNYVNHKLHKRQVTRKSSNAIWTNSNGNVKIEVSKYNAFIRHIVLKYFGRKKDKVIRFINVLPYILPIRNQNITKRNRLVKYIEGHPLPYDKKDYKLLHKDQRKLLFAKWLRLFMKCYVKQN